MTSSDLHVYDREIHGSERTSLSVLSAHIPPGARVLDLGCGSGAVGRFLTRRGDGAVIDGLTLNTEEARAKSDLIPQAPLAGESGRDALQRRSPL